MTFLLKIFFCLIIFLFSSHQIFAAETNNNNKIVLKCKVNDSSSGDYTFSCQLIEPDQIKNLPENILKKYKNNNFHKISLPFYNLENDEKEDFLSIDQDYYVFNNIYYSKYDQLKEKFGGFLTIQNTKTLKKKYPIENIEQNFAPTRMALSHFNFDENNVMYDFNLYKPQEIFQNLSSNNNYYQDNNVPMLDGDIYLSKIINTYIQNYHNKRFISGDVRPFTTYAYAFGANNNRYLKVTAIGLELSYMTLKKYCFSPYIGFDFDLWFNADPTTKRLNIPDDSNREYKNTSTNSLYLDFKLKLGTHFVLNSISKLSFYVAPIIRLAQVQNNYENDIVSDYMYKNLFVLGAGITYHYKWIKIGIEYDYTIGDRKYKNVEMFDNHLIAISISFSMIDTIRENRYGEKLY